MMVNRGPHLFTAEGDINNALDQNKLGHKADGIFVSPVQNVPNVESRNSI